eukprot:m.164487 g.164487  ORF g.164487 m.164487 type:complete len:339 (+) comp12431_c0_seq1:386-1402(+)
MAAAVAGPAVAMGVMNEGEEEVVYAAPDAPTQPASPPKARRSFWGGSQSTTSRKPADDYNETREPTIEPTRTEFDVAGLGTGVIVTTCHGTVFCKIRCGTPSHDEPDSEADDDVLEDTDDVAMDHSPTSTTPPRQLRESNADLVLDLKGVRHSLWDMANLDMTPCDDACMGLCCRDPKSVATEPGSPSRASLLRFSILSHAAADSDTESAESDHSDETEGDADDATPEGDGQDTAALETAAADDGDDDTKKNDADRHDSSSTSTVSPKERVGARLWAACCRATARPSKSAKASVAAQEPMPDAIPMEWFDGDDFEETIVFEAGPRKSNQSISGSAASP